MNNTSGEERNNEQSFRINENTISRRCQSPYHRKASEYKKGIKRYRLAQSVTERNGWERRL